MQKKKTKRKHSKYEQQTVKKKKKKKKKMRLIKNFQIVLQGSGWQPGFLKVNYTIVRGTCKVYFRVLETKLGVICHRGAQENKILHFIAFA